MKLKHLFYLQSVVVLNALVFIFAPAALLSRFGVTADAELELAFRNTGGLLLFVSLAAWFAAGAADSPLRRSLRLSLFIMHTVLFAVYALTQSTGGPAFGPIMWIHLVFALAFGYFHFIRPEA